MQLLGHTPSFSPAAARSLAAEFYGLRAAATALPSERDQNFLLATDAGERFILKIANALEERGLLEAQQEVLTHLAQQNFLCPRIVLSLKGNGLVQIESGANAKHFVRVVTYLPGIPLASVGRPAPELLKDLGRKLGQLDRALANFDHAAIHRDFHWDLRNGLRVIREYAPLVADDGLRKLVFEQAEAFERDRMPLLSKLRQSAIHNDANDYNILVDDADLYKNNRRVVGLIDFGDMVHSFTVADLAVAIAYAVLDKPDPLATAAHIVSGYHEENPINDDEIAALFGLVCLRLWMSVCHAAHQRTQRPADDYLTVSQRPIRNTLPMLAAINPGLAEARFRQACGFSGRLRAAAFTKTETLGARRKLLGANLALAYRDPLKIIGSSMQYLYGDDGRRYLDAYNNVPHVGHCHPRIVRAGQQQMAVLNTNTRYLHDLVNEYAAELSKTLPPPLSVCYFVNSGSEANELALRLARAHTQQRDIVVLEHAYHGNTTTLIDISPYKHNGPGGTGPPSWVHTAPIPDLFRGRYRRDDAQAGAQAGESYAQHVVEIIEQLGEHEVGLAGFIAESLPSVAGQVVFPDGYLERVYKAVRAAGGVCIADEVQTGYGRIGTQFWGFESYGVVPDIVVLGKPIGNGHPIGAVVTTPEIAASFANGMEFFSTFGGNTVSCAIGLAVLEVVHEEGLQAHALSVGEHLLDRLRVLRDTYEFVGDVRGSGLFLGVELVRNRETLEPATAGAALTVNRMRAEGILVGTDGPFHNVIKIRPPMPFSVDDADLLVETMDGIFANDLTTKAQRATRRFK
jgi:4-aminobutyrate aminotransferase-like enzyme/Ser/Thr protein kinase RdoA (MazF antagonist)